MDDIFRVNVGDRYNDGHGMYESFVIKSNFNNGLIHEAHRKACKEKLGFIFEDVCCRDYEEDELQDEEAEKLLARGLIDEDDLAENGSGKYYLDPESYLRVYMEIARLVLGDKFKWEVLKFPTYDIGGYGLFYG